MKNKMKYIFVVIGIIVLFFYKHPYDFQNNMVQYLLLIGSILGFFVFSFLNKRNIGEPTKILVFRILLIYGIILFMLSSIMICVKNFKVGFAEYDICFVDLFLSLFSYSMLRHLRKIKGNPKIHK